MIRIHRKYLIVPTVIGSIFVSLIGCQKKTSDSPIIAQIGNSVLTVNDLYKSIPQQYLEQITREQNIEYVKQWIDNELLFREALRRNFDKEQPIKERLEKMKKDLLIAELISRSSQNISNISIDQNSITEYYNQHQNEFIREKELVKFLEIIVDDVNKAWHIKQNATLQNFAELSTKYSKMPYSDTLDIPFIPIDEIQSDFRQTIFSTPVASTSNPLKTDRGYHIIQVLEKLPKGGICTEDEIRDEIITILSSKKHKENIEKTLSDLRLKNNIQFNLNLITGNNNEQNKNTTNK
jgi:parvulin-like peptidyl-prolyl isomerase